MVNGMLSILKKYGIQDSLEHYACHKCLHHQSTSLFGPIYCRKCGEPLPSMSFSKYYHIRRMEDLGKMMGTLSHMVETVNSYRSTTIKFHMKDGEIKDYQVFCYFNEEIAYRKK